MDVIEIDDFELPVVDLTYEEEQKMDDDLDYALAYCLQIEFEEDSVPDNTSSKQDFLEFKDVSILDNTSKKKAWNHKANVDQDVDYLLALQLQREFAKENGMNSSSSHSIPNGKPKFSNQNVHVVKQKGGKLPSSIVDPEWEVLDPIPDIHSLFLQFNSEYFSGRLEGVEVRWSPRMTLCAGICCYEGRGGLCSVRLSQPLLKYRPRRDLVETLLHEMIHAYLFVTHNNKDHDAHGPEFLKHMNRINHQTGTRISVYHSFHSEVDLHRKHWWKCDGPCQRRSPFFGLVKRAMNRAPSPRDPWWAQHQATCGGTFKKIKEPENFAQKKNLKRKCYEAADGKPGLGDIRKFFSENSVASKENQSLSNTESSGGQPGISNIHTISPPHKKTDKCGKDISSFVPFSGKGHTLGSSVPGSKAVDFHFRNDSNIHSKLLENKVTKLPPVGNSFPSQRKETKNSRSPMQGKPSLHSESKSKHPGSLSTLASNGKGTAVKFSSTSGSRTIVIPKNAKATRTKVVENPSDLPKIPFKGEGLILGSGPRTSNKKESNSPRSTVLPSTSESEEQYSRDLLDNSFDSIFPRTYNKAGNTKHEPHFLKKEVSATQSKINLQPVSPDRRNCHNIKPESCSEINSNASRHMKCPVCGSMVRDFAINAHLDTCLEKFS